MFNYDQGLGPGKWLKWFMPAMVIYAVSTFWPANGIAVFLGSVFGTVGLNIAWYQIRKHRAEK
jgi:hypothetical protein